MSQDNDVNTFLGLFGMLSRRNDYDIISSIYQLACEFPNSFHQAFVLYSGSNRRIRFSVQHTNLIPGEVSLEARGLSINEILDLWVSPDRISPLTVLCWVTANDAPQDIREMMGDDYHWVNPLGEETWFAEMDDEEFMKLFRELVLVRNDQNVFEMKYISTLQTRELIFNWYQE